MKVLVFRDKNNRIICTEQCPQYKNARLQDIIDEFNSTDPDKNTVEVKSIKPDTLEAYLYNCYISKQRASTKNEIEESIKTIYEASKRLSTILEVLLNDYEQKFTKLNIK